MKASISDSACRWCHLSLPWLMRRDQAGQHPACADLHKAVDLVRHHDTSTHSRQRTIPVTCSTSRRRISYRARSMASAVTLATKGN